MLKQNNVSAYSVEILDGESLMDTLHLSTTFINELFTDLLRQKRGFKYLLTTRLTLKNALIMDLKLEGIILIQK